LERVDGWNIAEETDVVTDYVVTKACNEDSNSRSPVWLGALILSTLLSLVSSIVALLFGYPILMAIGVFYGVSLIVFLGLIVLWVILPPFHRTLRRLRFELR